MHCKLEPKEIQAIQRSNTVQQTSFWAKIKTKQGFDAYAFQYQVTADLLFPTQPSKTSVKDDILVLIKQVDTQRSIAYVPYGPIDAENHGLFLEELSEVLRSYLPRNCIFIRYDLPWENLWSNDDDFYDSLGNWIGPPTVKNQEFRVNFNTRNWNLVKSHSNILPSNTLFLNLKSNPELLLKAMKPKTV